MGRVVKFTKPKPRRADDRTDPRLMAVGIASAFAVGAALAYAATPKATTMDAVGERTVHFEMCGRVRQTCVVDGDTIWLEGQNLRLASYDTPEPYDGICGGAAEVALAKKASARLLQLLNDSAITVETFGLDNTGKRTLATIRINGQDVGDILIAEKLARRWPDGEEWWCP